MEAAEGYGEVREDPQKGWGKVQEDHHERWDGVHEDPQEGWGGVQEDPQEDPCSIAGVIQVKQMRSCDERDAPRM